MDSAGAIAGPLFALFLLSRFGIRTVFWAAAIPGALCVLVALLGIRETKRSGEEDAATRTAAAVSSSGPIGSNDQSGKIKLPAGFYFVLIAVTLFSLGNSSDMFLVLRAQNLGIRVALAPLLGLPLQLCP